MTGECISVLNIEDNPGDARLVQEALKGTANPSYQVIWVPCLSSGLARLADGGIDAIALDLGLPDGQGLATLSRIRFIAPAIPVVVLSGAADEQFAVEAVHAGAQDYLVKAHVNGHTLTRALRYAIERKRSEEARRESEQRLHLAMTAAAEVIWEFNPGTVLEQRRESQIRTFPGTPESGSPAKLWALRVHPEDRDRVQRSFFDALDGTAVSWRADYKFLGSDGNWSYIQDRAVIARDSSGDATRVVGAMLDVTSLKRAEQELREANEKLRQLSRDLLRAQDYERRRIARELHDSTAQLLAALSINFHRLQEPTLEPERRRQLLTEASDLAAACSSEIRTVTYLLHPPLLDEVGLSSAIRAYAQGFNHRTGIDIEIQILPDFPRISGDMESALFRIFQEGLANVHKHSGSRLAVVRLERDAEEVRLVLRDRGIGLPEVLRKQTEGFVRFGVGIMGMRERAEQLGGRLELDSNDEGTKLVVSLPLVHCNDKNESLIGR